MLLKLIISIDMDLIQSFVFTIGRCGLGRYEQRILMKIVEHAQQSLAGKLIKNNLTQWQHDYDNVLLSFPVRDLMLDNDKHYERVFDAAEKLMSKKFSFQSASGNWFATPIIYNVYHAAGSGVLSFYVARRIFDVILDFSKGFRQFSLSQALQIPSPYACRLFALMSGQSVPLTLSIDELKKMFGVEEKYSQTADFIKKCIEPSKVILDDLGLTSFSYTRKFEGRKVTALSFCPIRRYVADANKEAAKISTSIYVAKELTLYMMRVGGFSLRELGAHKVMLDEFSKIPAAYEILADVINRAQMRGKSKGYIISALRSELDAYKRHLQA